MLSYSTYNIQFKKHPVEDCVVVSGEIRNDTNKNYNTAVFRLQVFVGHECIGASLIKLRGFRSRATRDFEVLVEGVHRDLLSKIARCEILFESAY
jgi:hypothetical protein